ncbi:MAG: 1,4-dihydroxy-2-naphthoate polyprenyltransferase [Caldilineaceae bacterium]
MTKQLSNPVNSQPTKVQSWVMASRPKTLPAAVGPVFVGAALAAADGRFALLPALGALLGALLIQIGSNFANDYSDFFKGADTHERLGPTRATAAGLLTPGEMRGGMIVVFGLAALIGLYLIYAGGWPILALGVASILAAIAYTGGPFPFGYYGLGDLFCFIFFGLGAVCGTYFVQTRSLTTDVWLAAIPVGALITAILVVNNLRDIDTDRKANKRTLAVMLGRAGARIEYLTLVVVAYLAPLLLWLVRGHGFWVMLPWLSLLLAVPLVRSVFTLEGRPLNPVLAGTARLSLVFSLLLAIGVVL